MPSGLRFNMKTVFPNIEYAEWDMMIRLSRDRFILRMGIPKLVSRFLDIETKPWSTNPEMYLNPVVSNMSAAGPAS